MQYVFMSYISYVFLEIYKFLKMYIYKYQLLLGTLNS